MVAILGAGFSAEEERRKNREALSFLIPTLALNK